MRYFKCDSFTQNREYRQLYTALTEQERRIYRKHRLLSKLSLLVFLLVAGLILAAGYFLGKYLFSYPQQNVWITIVTAVVEIVCAVCVVIAALALGLAASVPLLGTKWDNEKAARRQLLHQRCKQLREYYGFREPFLVTKCFDSSDKRFRRHDVCLFAADGELRLVVNLPYGFFDPNRDLGCYCFSPEEVTLCITQWEEHAAAQLSAGETTFLLGSRALPFLQKQWLNQDK